MSYITTMSRNLLSFFYFVFAVELFPSSLLLTVSNGIKVPRALLFLHFFITKLLPLLLLFLDVLATWFYTVMRYLLVSWLVVFFSSRSLILLW
jgi:hypothetical protein